MLCGLIFSSIFSCFLRLMTLMSLQEVSLRDHHRHEFIFCYFSETRRVPRAIRRSWRTTYPFIIFTFCNQPLTSSGFFFSVKSDYKNQAKSVSLMSSHKKMSTSLLCPWWGYFYGSRKAVRAFHSLLMTAQMNPNSLFSSCHETLKGDLSNNDPDTQSAPSSRYSICAYVLF